MSFVLQFYRQPDTIARIAERVHACGRDNPRVSIEFLVNADSSDEREAWHSATQASPTSDFVVFSPNIHEVSSPVL